MNRLNDQSHRTLTVGLLWHSLSSDNLGVGALTLGQIEICREAATLAGVDLRFIVFGTTGRLSYGPNDGTVRVGSRLSIKQMLLGRSMFVSEIGECDLVLDIGEGDSFTDIYGMKRLLFLVVSKIVVLAKRIPLILSPQTIGPFDHWYSRAVAVAVMRRCTKVFARDKLSAEYLEYCGVSGNTDEVVDVAFRLPYSPMPSSIGEVRRIGLNVSGLLFAGGYTGANQFGLTVDYAKLTRDLLTRWTAQANTEVWLIAHVVPDGLPRDDDRTAINVLLKEFPTARSAPDFSNPSEAKSFISSMDFVTAARMHACIAALSAGVPVVPFAYSRKFNGLFTSLGYGHVADGKRHTIDEAQRLILDGFAALGDLRRDAGSANTVASQKLARYSKYLVSLFKETALARPPK